MLAFSLVLFWCFCLFGEFVCFGVFVILVCSILVIFGFSGFLYSGFVFGVLLGCLLFCGCV